MQQVPAAMQQMQKFTGVAPASSSPEVERFLDRNPVDTHAAARLRALPWDLQRMVLSRGTLEGGRDRTAALLVRIDEETENFQAIQLTAQQMATPGVPTQTMNADVERFLGEVKIEAHAASRLRTLPWEYQQAVIARGSMLGNRDSTAVVMGRISAVTRGALNFNRNLQIWQVVEVTKPDPAAQPAFPNQTQDRVGVDSDEKDDIDAVMQRILDDAKQNTKKKKRLKDNDGDDIVEAPALKKAAPTVIMDWRSSRTVFAKEVSGENQSGAAKPNEAFAKVAPPSMSQPQQANVNMSMPAPANPVDEAFSALRSGMADLKSKIGEADEDAKVGEEEEEEWLDCWGPRPGTQEYKEQYGDGDEKPAQVQDLAPQYGQPADRMVMMQQMQQMMVMMQQRKRNGQVS